MMDELPKGKTAKDIAYDFGTAIIAGAPYVGGPLQVLFESIFASPLKKRREIWADKLVSAVNELNERFEDITPEKLASNEIFITVAMQASQIAIRNHQEEKLEALRNAVLNSALPNSSTEDELLIFLRLIDQLTVSHIRVLGLLSNPEEALGRTGRVIHDPDSPSIFAVIAHCFQDLLIQADTLDQIIRDLKSEGLVRLNQELRIQLPARGALESRTTDRGNRFLRFITSC